jgi:type I restriction enzyme S subunit
MGKTIISPYNSATNQQINSIEVNLRALRNFLFLSLKNRRDELYLLGSSGSTMPIVNKSTFERLKNLVPHEKILSSFDSFVEPLFNKILASTVEIQDVAILRDTLLPKLLSGQLRVPDAEKLMAEAL